ncbi:S1C family serine protease [Sulfuricystis multivorans]|uniref:S1C family serine protease n=1 Tax=Sulfuricystis multivorans TaxID=2211108 RepID=UPI000F84CEFA|nr:serine protease [Sulfuricystis multivorans]
MKPRLPGQLLFALLCCLMLALPARAGLPDTIERIKPSLVVIGLFNKLKSPAFQMRGTGFAVGDGRLIATNAHVVPEITASDTGEDQLAVLARFGSERRVIPARLVARDADHDLALLRFDGPPLTTVTLGDSDAVREGQAIAFSGFPIGSVLGFSPVTHRGIVSSITPISVPGNNAHQLKAQSIRSLRSGSFPIFQLDATAYPGNSGGPLFDADSGEVVGIINMVFIKTTKESILEKPSGISYAIPAKHLAELLRNSETRR